MAWSIRTMVRLGVLGSGLVSSLTACGVSTATSRLPPAPIPQHHAPPRRRPSSWAATVAAQLTPASSTVVGPAGGVVVFAWPASPLSASAAAAVGTALPRGVALTVVFAAPASAVAVPGGSVPSATAPVFTGPLLAQTVQTAWHLPLFTHYGTCTPAALSHDGITQWPTVWLLNAQGQRIATYAGRWPAPILHTALQALQAPS